MYILRCICIRFFCPAFCEFWGSFRGPLRLQNWSKNCLFWFHFWNPFFWGLEALQVPLGSLPEPLMLILGASKTRKVWFSHCKITHFENYAFWYFKALDLAHSNPKTDPKTDPKMDPKLDQNLFHFWSHFWALFGHFGGPFWGQKPNCRNMSWLRKCGFTIRKTTFFVKMTWFSCKI